MAEEDGAPAKRQRSGVPEAAAEAASGSEDCSRRSPSQTSARQAADDDYFDAYDHLSIHALMLADESRVGAYAAAIRAHRGSIQDRVVLDVGAGTGILSLLAAKHGGAARVYAVEAVPGIAGMARALALRNGLEQTVQVIEGRVEEVELPEKVDVIISEWMGFYLVHESMLDSVLIARDKWLKPGGVMLPTSAKIWAAPVSAEALRQEVESYNCLHGLDLSLVGAAELQRHCREPQVEAVEPSRLLATPLLAMDLGDLRQLPRGGTAELSAEVEFIANRAGNAAGIAFWFDVGFGAVPSASDSGQGHRSTQEVVLSTGPGAPLTHWKQTVVYLGAFAPVEAGESLSAQLTLAQSPENPRQYNISVAT